MPRHDSNDPLAHIPIFAGLSAKDRDEVRSLPVEVRKFEPRATLTDGSEDGLGLVRRLAADAPSWLRPGGYVLVEIAPYLARSTATVLRRAGLREVRSNRDNLGVTRVVAGRM